MAISALIGLTVAISFADAGQTRAALPEWLTGEWVCREQMLAGGPLVRSESWARDDWHGLTGGVRGGLARAGSTLSEISLARIIDLGDGLTLSYSAASGPVREYRAVETGNDVLVFEAEGDGAPRRITYRRTAYSLTVTHSGAEGGETRSWRYTRAGNHTGMSGC